MEHCHRRVDTLKRHYARSSKSTRAGLSKWGQMLRGETGGRGSWGRQEKETVLLEGSWKRKQFGGYNEERGRRRKRGGRAMKKRTATETGEKR